MSQTPHHAHHAHHAGPPTGHERVGEVELTGHDPARAGEVRSMALSATLHCLTGCAIGEVAGLVLGTALGLSTGWTIALAVSLAFLFGYALSTLPLVKAGAGVGAALSVVLAADTLSIATMEVVDNAVMALVPGAMHAGLVNPVFWLGMMVALGAAALAAYPVNLYLMQRGKGHALTHRLHAGAAPAAGWRRHLPSFATSTLVGIVVAFLLGGLVVSVADRLSGSGAGGSDESGGGGHAAAASALHR